jgi:predicted nuclease with TOPRIM domain
MAFNPRTWYPIAVLASFANVVAFAFAVSPGSPWHATIHAGLAVGFGVWAQQLKLRLREPVADRQDEAETAALRDEVEELRRGLNELQERQDFVERLLSQAREMDRLPGREPDQRQ